MQKIRNADLIHMKHIYLFIKEQKEYDTNNPKNQKKKGQFDNQLLVIFQGKKKIHEYILNQKINLFGRSKCW